MGPWTLKRIVVTGSLVGLLLAASSGCGDPQDGPGQLGNDRPATNATPSPSPEPDLILAKAVIGLGKQNLKYTVDGGNRGVLSGDLDAANGAVKVSTELDGSPVELVRFDNDIYIGGILDGGRWLHALVPKFKDGAISVLAAADPLFGAKFLGTASDVRQDGPNAFSGTIDLTSVIASGAMQRIASVFGRAAGANATELPFTATVDDAGALSAVKMVFPKADRGKDLTYNLTITEVGGTATIIVPAKDKTVAAGSDFYTGP